MRRAISRVVWWIAGSVALLLLAVVLTSAAGTARFHQRYEREKRELLARGRDSAAAARDSAAALGLPAPVQTYLDRTRPHGRIAVATLEQTGVLRAAPDQPWMPFRSEQAYSFDPPGFVWLARARIAPLLDMMAKDRYVDGHGNMFVQLLGWITVADGRGPEFDQGAGLRYWGEVLAFPEAVLDPRIRWRPIDARHAALTVDRVGAPLEAVVEFDEQGLPSAFHAPRYRDVAGRSVLTPWSGRMGEWKEFGGRLFPSRWESVWHLDGGDFVAVRMEILAVNTE